MKIFAQNLVFGTKMKHNHAEMLAWPKTEPEVNSHDIIIQSNVGNKFGLSFWVIIRDIRTKFGTTQYKKQTTIMEECAELTYCENASWRRPPYWIVKTVNISGFDESCPYEMIVWTEIKTGKLIRVTWRYQVFRLHALPMNAHLVLNLFFIRALCYSTLAINDCVNTPCSYMVLIMSLWVDHDGVQWSQCIGTTSWSWQCGPPARLV